MRDDRQFNIYDPDRRLLCPACGFPDYSFKPAYAECGGVIGVAICPCCLWEPGFDDDPSASSSASDTILASIHAYRLKWSDVPQWHGKTTKKPRQWNAKKQFDELMQIAPHVR